MANHRSTLVDRMAFRGLLLILLAAPCTAETSATQDRTAVSADAVIVSLTDGSTLVGTVVADEDEALTVRTASGLEVRLPRNTIASMGKAVGIAPRSDPNDTRLMFAETGRPLQKGAGYFSNHYVLFPGFSYGLTDHLSVSGGMSVVPGFGLHDQAYYVSSKLGFRPSPKTALALGVLYAGGTEEDYGAALLYGVATFGTPDRSLSLGIGHGATREREELYGPDYEYLGSRSYWDSRAAPILMVGGSVRLSDHLLLLSESWLFLGDDFQLSDQPFGVAIRFHGDRLSADVGLVLVGDVLEDGLPIPWLSVTYRFGTSRRSAQQSSPTLPTRLLRAHRP
jgi:hypothetical protein